MQRSERASACLAGEVDELVRKLEEGKLSPQEVLEEVKRRNDR